MERIQGSYKPTEFYSVSSTIVGPSALTKLVNLRAEINTLHANTQAMQTICRLYDDDYDNGDKSFVDKYLVAATPLQVCKAENVKHIL